MRQIALHGQEKRYEHFKIGLNGKLDIIKAALLLAKFNIFAREVNLRKRIRQKYIQKLNKLGFQKTPKLGPQNTSVYAQYTIQVEAREEVIDFLEKRSIPTTINYPRLLPDQEALSNKNNGFIKNFFHKNTYK